VWVTGRAFGDQVVVQIADGGVGLPSSRREQLNALLAQPPAIDIAAVRAMGLTVVGHIAARYDIAVHLSPGQLTGTLAEVTIPSSVFRPIMGPQLAPVGVPSAVASVSWPLNDLFTPSRPVQPNLFSVPTQELRAVSAGLPGPGAWPPLPEPEVPAAFAAVVNEPIELPIFQSVNGWFRTESSGPSASSDGFAYVSAGPVNWESSVDAGWLAAAQAATPEVSSTTASGLPVRAPQRHLVPGAAEPAERGPATAPRRDPTRVAAAMSAYARGVAGRRTPAS
jgi:hypothetical protein